MMSFFGERRKIAILALVFPLMNAKKKLVKKNFDFVVLNSLKDKGAGFGGNTNKVTIYHQSNKKNEFDLKSKNEVAVDIVNTLVETYLSA